MYKIKDIESYINEKHSYEIDNITYEMYSEYLGSVLNENVFNTIKDRVTETALKVLRPIREFVVNVANDFNVGISKVVEAFRNRSIFDFLKAIRFNFRSILRALKDLTGLVRQGILGIFERLAKSNMIERIRSGVSKIDDFFDEYPLLRKVAGIAIAGILIYIWLNMTFIGDFDYDFNWADIIAAFAGSFTLVDLFLSPAGLMMITLFVTGPFISVPWLGASTYNLIVALFYTGYVKLRDADNDVINRIRSIVK